MAAAQSITAGPATFRRRGHDAGTAANGYADHPAVFRPATGTWYLMDIGKVRWGTRGDVPVPGDYNGDNKTDVAVYRPSNGVWYIPGRSNIRFGEPGDLPVTGDYDGDGRTDIAVYRPSTGQWFMRGHTPVSLGTRTKTFRSDALLRADRNLVHTRPCAVRAGATT